MTETHFVKFRLIQYNVEYVYTKDAFTSSDFAGGDAMVGEFTEDTEGVVAGGAATHTVTDVHHDGTLAQFTWAVHDVRHSVK